MLIKILSNNMLYIYVYIYINAIYIYICYQHSDTKTIVKIIIMEMPKIIEWFMSNKLHKCKLNCCYAIPH